MKVILIIEDEKNMGINNKYVNLNEEKLEVNELNINSSEEIITRIINQHNLSIDPKLFGRLSRAISS